MKRFVKYIRVSTKGQGDSGLGLEAQERDIALYLSNYAETPYEVIGSFCDIQSGADNKRTELTKAIELAKTTGATLLVAKLDRLSRRVSFIATLMEDAKLDFAVASLPNADKVMLHLYAVMAEAERDFISTRTKAALKASTKKLGGLRAGTKARNDGAKAKADNFAKERWSLIKTYRQAGKTYAMIAEEMNHLKVETANGGKWFPATVRNIEKRMLKNQ